MNETIKSEGVATPAVHSLNGITYFHTHINVRVLLHLPDCDLEGLLKHKTEGRHLTPREARAALTDLLAEGVEALPIGGSCDLFDYKTGCPGHQKEST